MTQLTKRVITVRLTESQMKDPVALLEALRGAARNVNVNIRVKKQPELKANGLADDHQHIPDVHSKEFERLNDRRFALIQKESRKGLDEAETAELERLQEIIGAAVDKKYPRTPPPWEELREVEACLKA